MATLQIAKVTRYFHNQTDFMAKELFDTLQWGDIGLNGTAALNFIDDDHGELKITSDTHTFPEPFSYIYRYRDNHSVTYSYWYATDIKMRGQDFVILSVTKNWWLTAFVQNPRIYKNLIQTEITWIRSPFFKTWMLDVEDPLLSGVLENSTRKAWQNAQQYWVYNEIVKSLYTVQTPRAAIQHWWFRKGQWGQTSTNSSLNNYAVFIIPQQDIYDPSKGIRISTLNLDGTSTLLKAGSESSNARAATLQDLLVMVPVMNAFDQSYKTSVSRNKEIYMNFDPAGFDGNSASSTTDNAILNYILRAADQKWSTYFKGYFIGIPPVGIADTAPVVLRTDKYDTNEWTDSQRFKGLYGFAVPLKEGIAFGSLIPDITDGARIGGQQLGTVFFPRYLNDPQPNILLLNYLDTKMNGASVKYGSLIAGARKSPDSRRLYLSDGYASKNDYVDRGIQTMQLYLTWNGRFMINKRTNYTSIRNHCEQYTYFQQWPTIYLPTPIPNATSEYNDWLKANNNQLQTAKQQAQLTTQMGLFMGLMTATAAVTAPATAGTSTLLLGGLAASGSALVQGNFKQQQINAQYRDAANSLGSQVSQVADSGIEHVVKQWFYFSNNGGFNCLELTGKETWEIDSYEPNANNFSKLNNVIFFNGFYGTVSSAIFYKPSGMHCAYFQANDNGLFNKISDAVFKDDNSNNPAHEFIKPSYVQALTDAFNTGMRLWYSNPATINMDLATKQRGVSTIEYEANDRTISMPNSAISSMLTCQHLIVKDKIIANEQSSSQ